MMGRCPEATQAIDRATDLHPTDQQTIAFRDALMAQCGSGAHIDP